MTDDLVKRADEALKDVTPGPWWTNGKYSGSEMGCAIIAARTDCGPLPGNPTRGMVAWASAVLNTKARECEANARFIAAARELVPAMRDRIEADAKRIAVLEKLRPLWAEGFTSDSIAAQVTASRLLAAEARIAELGAENARLRRTVEAAAKLGRIVGFLGEDEELIEAFREECGPDLLARARAALGEKKE